MKKIIAATLTSMALTVPFVPAQAQMPAQTQVQQVGLKPHVGCFTNDRHDLNNQWCLWDARHMHDGVGDRHDHSGYFDRGRNWHPRKHAVIHFACERRCFS